MAVNINVNNKTQKSDNLAVRIDEYIIGARTLLNGISVFVLDKDKKIIYEKFGILKSWCIQDGVQWLLDNEKINIDSKMEKGILKNVI